MPEDYRDVPLNKLRLDSHNPRLSRELGDDDRTPDRLLREFAQRYNLIELARSIADKGFTPRQAEALLVVKDDSTSNALTVVEGNRRLATLLLLTDPRNRRICQVGSEWNHLATTAMQHDLHSAPVIVYQTRDELDDYLGFRHISGPTPWRPEAKARFIDRLLSRDVTIRDVARRIGSTRPTVRRYAEAYIVFEQAGNHGLDMKIVETGFGVFYNALGYEGHREFIGLGAQGPPDVRPRDCVPTLPKDRLSEFIALLFGDDSQGLSKVIGESRDLSKLSRVLEDPIARVNLLRDRDLDRAWRTTGGGKDDIIGLLRDLYVRLAEVNGQAREYRDYQDVKDEVSRVCVIARDLAERYNVEDD